MPNKKTRIMSAKAPKDLSPAMRVFNTVELFEQIYMNVDQIDMLRAERVSRDFKMIIDCSKPLKRRLFCLPAQMRSYEKVLGNTLLQQLPRLPLTIPPFPFGMEIGGLQYTLAWGRDINPSVKGHIVGGERSNPPLELRLDRWDQKRHRKSKEADGTIGSWKRMFLTQPPIKMNVTVVQWGKNRYWDKDLCDYGYTDGVWYGYDRSRSLTRHKVEACTMGELLEQVHWESTHIGLFGMVEEPA